ncbi:MAG TPA: M14 family zinc carboxypeptidase [Bacteroidia bacterium]|nr:M14 family zinc carboxypeptidase [Bacteroidia bacterium]
MPKYFLLFTFISISSVTFCQSADEKYHQNETVTVKECIDFYKGLSYKYANVHISQMGFTDMNQPLYCITVSKENIFDSTKTSILINNGIHPGEPCGVDACMVWIKNILSSSDSKKLLDNVNLVIIPIYNVDGALNRNSYSRANQNGPKEYGFRGNAINLDLNRDFMKCDSRNTFFFHRVFQLFKPEIFVDTHISDGADYTYTMTLIATQHNKFHPVLAAYMDTVMLPFLYNGMDKKNNTMFPYVESVAEIPDSGIAGFLDIPRFSTGYTSLFNTISFVTETHMLKPYPAQVQATIDFLQTLLEFTHNNAAQIKAAKLKADKLTATQKSFDINWKQTDTLTDSLLYKGYAAKYKKSNITGKDRLYYDEQQTITKKIPFYNECTATEKVIAPRAYIIPQQWWRVIDILRNNKIEMSALQNDSMIEVNCYYITDYETTKKPYENHYLHSKIKTRGEVQKIQFHKGDLIIYCNQQANNYLANLLEPAAVDGVFAWNHFDAILQQKEWFSDYVFEDVAEKLLQTDAALKTKFDAYVKENKIENDANAQLIFLYRNSPYYEKSHNRFPVYKIVISY